jgi:methylene-tetrahydromethanopterin dehydrogenase
VDAADGSDERKKADLLKEAEAVFAAGRAGVQILTKAQVAAAKNLLIAADVNAVPPAGIEGLAGNANGDVLAGNALGIGALAIGGIKYKTEFGLFKKMIEATKPVTLDFRDAFALARELNG